MKKIRLILVEDNRLLREGINAMLKKEKDINVISTYGDRDFDIDEVCDMNPAVVLLDLGLPNQNSFELVKILRKKCIDMKIIIMGIVPIHEEILQFVQAGASGFILKDAGVQDFLKTIRLVNKGEKILPAYLMDSLFAQIVNEAAKNKKKSGLMKSVRLTKRERQIIEHVAEGLTNKEIGKMLYLSPFTVKSHVHNILEKLAIHNRIEIAKFAHSDDYNKLKDSLSLIDGDENET